MKAGPRERIVWLENKLMLENMNIALTHLFFQPKGASLQRASTTLTNGFPLSDKHYLVALVGDPYLRPISIYGNFQKSHLPHVKE